MRLKLQAISAFSVFLVAILATGVAAQTPGPQVTVEQVRAKFADMDIGTVRALGYAVTSECVVSPAGGAVMGYHAYKPGSLDNKLDPLDPEILLLLPKGNSLRVVGVEWEATGDGPFTLLGQTLHRSEGHPGMWFPHHALHLFFEPNVHFAEFSAQLTGRCTPLPVADTAFAELSDASGRSIGLVRFTETTMGIVEISLEASGLPPGVHAAHVHATGRCDAPDFTSAGGHFNPFNKSHGIYFSPNGPHAGDMFGTGILVTPDGSARWRDASDRFAISSGPARLLDGDGAAVIIHIGTDDQHTDPTGNAGARIACGVITRGQPTSSPAPAVGAAPAPATAPPPAARSVTVQPPRTGDGNLIGR